MKEVVFDFERIGSTDDFYVVAKRELQLPDHFGKNLDALWDCLTGGIELPLAIRFDNMSMQQLEAFEKLLQLFEDAADELGDSFIFEYYLRQDR